MDFEVHVLGTAAARPYPDRPASAVAVRCGGTRILLDCGEGTLVALDQSELSAAKLDAICISHMHGDHVYGLPGLLTTLALGGRTQALTLLGPPNLEAYLHSVFSHSEAQVSYPLEYQITSAISPQSNVLLFRDLVVHTHPLRHRIPAVGFSVSERQLGRRLRKGIVEQLNINYAAIPSLRQGEDYVDENNTCHPNEKLTLDPSPARRLAYLTDTAPLERVSPEFCDADVLIHDATFLPEHAHLGQRTGHSTTVEAAAFAKTCGAKRLLLTHFSSRYAQNAEALAEAKKQFSATEWALSGQVIRL